jgi:glycosyltransferase involved in cell wall biosynthesis
MSRVKTSLVSLSEDRYWQSCYLITNGLRQSYASREIAKHTSVTEWRLSRFNSEASIAQTASEIVASKPDWLVFLDTSPLYGILIKRINEIQATKNRPRLRFHVYGDFTLRSYLWKHWEEDLRGYAIEWVCASTAQERLVKAFCDSKSRRTWVCPFPLKTAPFQFDFKSRKQMRKSLGLSDSDFLIYYSGRLTMQKNVLANLKIVRFLKAETLARTHFVFAGDFDDRGGPFEGTHLPKGGIFQLWQDAMATLKSDQRQRVHLLPGLAHSSQSAMYSAADCFLSLSLQHDEDFGMAPAEAACSGLPLILTSWGGYQDFHGYGARGSLVNVNLASTGPRFSLRAVAKEIEKCAKIPQNLSERIKAGSEFSKNLSIHKAAEKIRFHSTSQKDENRPPEFKKFNSLMKMVAGHFNPHKGHLVFSDLKKGSVYEKVYRHYV